MSSDTSNEQLAAHEDLIQTLIEHKLISSAQAQLALTDQKATGMSLDEILLARGWISLKQLEQFAPALIQETSPSNKDKATLPENATYQDSLREYRRLLEKIRGTSWD